MLISRERAMSATDDDAVIDLASEAVEWQGMALLDLAGGKTIAEVRETLGLDRQAPADPAQDEDDALLEGLRTPAAQMQFAWIEDEEELRQVIEGGDFAKWRVFLHPEQRKYVGARTNGPFRLSGGAGTGKTVVLLHRARELSRRDPSARIVLTTFTRNLADDMRRDLAILDPDVPLASALGEPGVFVTGLDAAAGSVVSKADEASVAQAVGRVLGPGGNRAQPATLEVEHRLARVDRRGGLGSPGRAAEPGVLRRRVLTRGPARPHHDQGRVPHSSPAGPRRGAQSGPASRRVGCDRQLSRLHRYRRSRGLPRGGGDGQRAP